MFAMSSPLTITILFVISYLYDLNKIILIYNLRNILYFFDNIELI